MTKEPRLCYVRLPWCYFTKHPINSVEGDDWDDAPYEHNAGLPYKYDAKVAVETNMVTPDDGYANSPYSVEDINNGAVAWLYNRETKVSIMAGTTLKEFGRLIVRAGGVIYECRYDYIY